jgi:hypothetical protein
MQRPSFFPAARRASSGHGARLSRSLHSLLLAMALFSIACTDYGQLGCSGHCDHPWDGKEGSCPLPNVAAGEVGGSCNSWPSPPCNSGGRCVDGTCLECGGNGEVCCTSGTSQVCNSGTCASSDDFAKCNDSCGLLTPGKDDCCPGTGTKCSQGVCDIDTHKCIQPQSDPCTGQNPYNVYLTDSNGCAQGPFYFTSNNDSEASSCVAHLKAVYGAQGACTLNQAVQESEVCGTSFLAKSTYIIDVCDAVNFSSCQWSQCTNCTFTSGACP